MENVIAVYGKTKAGLFTRRESYAAPATPDVVAFLTALVVRRTAEHPGQEFMVREYAVANAERVAAKRASLALRGVGSF